MADDKAESMLRILPVHAAPTVGGTAKQGTQLKIKRARGRPRKVERMPTTSDLEYHAMMVEERTKLIAGDPVVRAAAGRLDSVELLHMVKVEIAKEAADLANQRVENQKFGRDTATVSSRRIDALSKVASIEFEIKKLGADMVDLRGERFQRVFQCWIETLRDVAAEVLPAEQLDMLFNRLETALDGWEDTAAEAMKPGK
jgi:hypothetical protein